MEQQLTGASEQVSHARFLWRPAVAAVSRHAVSRAAVSRSGVHRAAALGRRRLGSPDKNVATGLAAVGPSVLDVAIIVGDEERTFVVVVVFAAVDIIPGLSALLLCLLIPKFSERWWRQ